MTQNTYWLPCYLLLISLSLFLACPQADAETTWQLRGQLVHVDVGKSEQQVLPDGTYVETAVDSDLGLALTFEARTSPRLGIEFGALALASPDILVQVGLGPSAIRVEDTFDLTILGGGLNFHLTPDAGVDVYVGPFAGLAQVGDLSFDLPGTDERAQFRLDDEFVYGAVLGADFPVGDHWSVAASARYLVLETGVDGADGPGEPLDLDGLVLGLGVGYRF